MLRLLLVISVLLVGLSPQTQLRAGDMGEREPLRLVIVHVSDLDRIEARGGRGGLAKLANLVGTIRSEHEHVLLTHGGDAIPPSVLSNFDQGAHMIDLLNRLDLDLFVLGNHEFDFGQEVTLERVAEADFPVLGSNLRRSDGTRLPGVEEEVMLEIAGWRIGVLGLLTPQTLTSSSPGDMAFTPEVDAAAERAAALRAEGADLVVALVHSGYEVDTALVRQGAVDLVLGAMITCSTCSGPPTAPRLSRPAHRRTTSPSSNSCFSKMRTASPTGQRSFAFSTPWRSRPTRTCRQQSRAIWQTSKRR